MDFPARPRIPILLPSVIDSPGRCFLATSRFGPALGNRESVLLAATARCSIPPRRARVTFSTGRLAASRAWKTARIATHHRLILRLRPRFRTDETPSDEHFVHRSLIFMRRIGTAHLKPTGTNPQHLGTQRDIFPCPAQQMRPGPRSEIRVVAINRTRVRNRTHRKGTRHRIGLLDRDGRGTRASAVGARAGSASASVAVDRSLSHRAALASCWHRGRYLDCRLGPRLPSRPKAGSSNDRQMATSTLCTISGPAICQTGPAMAIRWLVGRFLTLFLVDRSFLQARSCAFSLSAASCIGVPRRASKYGSIGSPRISACSAW